MIILSVVLHIFGAKNILSNDKCPRKANNGQSEKALLTALMLISSYCHPCGYLASFFAIPPLVFLLMIKLFACCLGDKM